mgnify:FL=1|jgi:hypothetical protein
MSAITSGPIEMLAKFENIFDLFFNQFIISLNNLFWNPLPFLYMRKHASLFIVAGLMFMVLGVGILSNGSLFLGEFQIEQTPPYPDLVVTDVAHGDGSLLVTVQNQGVLDVETTDYEPYLYLYVDGNREWVYSYAMFSDNAFTLVDGVSELVLEPLEGIHLVKACIDPTNAISEQDEYNNCYEETLY